MVKFKFPINSLVSWNARPKDVIFRVLGYDYEIDRYSLSVEKHYSGEALTADCYKPGYRFNSGRISTELHHTLVEPNIEWKFQIGDKIETSLKSVWEVTGLCPASLQYEFIVRNSWDKSSAGKKVVIRKTHAEVCYTLIEPNIELKFKVGDRICSRAAINKTIYTIMDLAKFVDCYIISSYGVQGAMLQTKEYTEKEYELYIPETPKCIPNDPTKSGWHWLKKNNKSIPHYWDHSYNWWWEPIKKFGTYQEDMVHDNWTYDKPCNY